MAETWDEAQLVADGFERIYIELEWYDGPRAGLADVGGTLHYFDGYGQYSGDGDDDYRVWPAAPAAAEWEREQWAIVVGWDERHGAAAGRPAAFLGEAGVDARYDELDALLAPYRRVPGDARRLAGELRHTGTGHRLEGTGYWFRWRPGSERGRDGTAAA
ncbi:hypothetical protein [Actinacidiphila bryophytorum]|uniref:hypothetical protein n=1 Tax=Actinacidiphila bryophytorum TaxID=1436133 RepID=UPI002176D716|nr:hypothetical protein [Actinacidiphila bryophytorum]UWE10386.1 hypothetical protein NYE86_17775 [Actinacidiphila bryophytorum]